MIKALERGVDYVIRDVRGTVKFESESTRAEISVQGGQNKLGREVTQVVTHFEVKARVRARLADKIRR